MTCLHTHTKVQKLTFWDGIQKDNPNLLTIAVHDVEYTPSLRRERIVRTDLSGTGFVCEGTRLNPGGLSFSVATTRELDNVSGIEVTLDRLLEYTYRGTLQNLWPDEPERFYGSDTSGKPLCVILHEPDEGYRIFRDAYIEQYTKTGCRTSPPTKEQYKIGVVFYSDPELCAEVPWLLDEKALDQ